VLLEAANFEPTGLFRSSERLRLRTEGSNRWEKGVDPYLAEQAARLATQLIVETAGAEWVGHTDVQQGLPERPVIGFRPRMTDAVVGFETPPADQLSTLRRLGFEVGYQDGYQIQESLDLDGRGAGASLHIVYDRHLELVRGQLPARVAEQVEADVEARAPAALASLFAGAIQRRLRNGSRAGTGRNRR
jgi:hypothetical protein